MLARTLRTTPRSLEEITRLIEAYPIYWRRWCSGPERGGCACAGCVRQPAGSTVEGDPEYAAWPNEADALNEQEVQIYRDAVGPMPPWPTTATDLHIRTAGAKQAPWPKEWKYGGPG